MVAFGDEASLAGQLKEAGGCRRGAPGMGKGLQQPPSADGTLGIPPGASQRVERSHSAAVAALPEMFCSNWRSCSVSGGWAEQPLQFSLAGS